MAGKHIQTFLPEPQYRALMTLKLQKETSIDQLLKEAVALLLNQEGIAQKDEEENG
jgi:hypothetical protein